MKMESLIYQINRKEMGIPVRFKFGRCNAVNKDLHYRLWLNGYKWYNGKYYRNCDLIYRIIFNKSYKFNENVVTEGSF